MRSKKNATLSKASAQNSDSKSWANNHNLISSYLWKDNQLMHFLFFCLEEKNQINQKKNVTNWEISAKISFIEANCKLLIKKNHPIRIYWRQTQCRVVLDLQRKLSPKQAIAASSNIAINQIHMVKSYSTRDLHKRKSSASMFDCWFFDCEGPLGENASVCVCVRALLLWKN